MPVGSLLSRFKLFGVDPQDALGLEFEIFVAEVETKVMRPIVVSRGYRFEFGAPNACYVIVLYNMQAEMTRLSMTSMT